MPVEGDPTAAKVDRRREGGPGRGPQRATHLPQGIPHQVSTANTQIIEQKPSNVFISHCTVVSFAITMKPGSF